MNPGGLSGKRYSPTLCLLLLYAPTAFAASVTGVPWLKSLLLPALVVAMAWRPLLRGSAGAWCALAGACGLIVVCARSTLLTAALPALAVLTLAGWFWWSLLPQSTPLIARFARAVHERQGQPIPSGSERWIRGWTVIWAAALTVFGAGSILLAVAERNLMWLLWMLVGLPLLLVVLLVLEYRLRLRRFPEYPHLSWGGFLRTLAEVRWRHLAP